MLTPTEHAQLLRELATDNEMLLEAVRRQGLLSLISGRQLIGDAAARARQAAEEIEGQQELEPELVESIARLIYEAMRFDRIDTTANWQEGGNSFAQDEARRCACAVLARQAAEEIEGRRMPTDEEIIEFWNCHCVGDGDPGIIKLARFGGGEIEGHNQMTVEQVETLICFSHSLSFAARQIVARFGGGEVKS